MPRRRVRALVFAILACATAAAPAQAGTPTWVPQTTFPAGSWSSPGLAVAPDNSAVAAWIKDSYTADAAVKIAGLAPGPGGTQTTTFSRAGISGTYAPGVAIAPTGDALVAWQDGAHAIGYSVRQAPGGFQDFQLLTVPGNAAHDSYPGPVLVTSDGNGEFLVVAAHHLEATYSPTTRKLDRLVAWRVSAGGTSSNPITIDTIDDNSPYNTFIYPSMSESPNGTALLAYTKYVGTTSTLRYAHRSSGDDWTAANVSGMEGGTTAGTAINAFSRGLLAGNGPSFTIRASAYDPADGSLDPIASGSSLSDPTHTAYSTDAGIDDSGRGTIVWHSTGAGGMFVQRTKADGTLDGPVQPLPETGSGPEAPRLAVNSAGAAFVLWSRYEGDFYVVEGGRRDTATGAFTAPAILPNSGGAGDPQVGIDSAGDAVAAFTDSVDEGPSTPVLVRQDAAAPSITPIQITNGPPDVGTPLGFNVTTSDRVSPVSVTWSFGDGDTGSGARATHTFDRRNRYTVTATARDTAGYTASTSTVVDLGKEPPAKHKAKPKFTTKIKASHLKFAVVPKHKKKHHKNPYGTTLSFKLSTPATVKLTVAHLTTGRRSKGKCRAPSHKLSTAKKCTRAVALKGSLSKKGKTGKNTLAFTGKLRGKALKPGRYKLTVSASNSAGKSKTATLTVRIVTSG